MNIQQGHKYIHNGREVLALESGKGLVKVADLDHSQPYPLGHARHVQAGDLTAQPMAYFHGKLPK